MKRIAIAICLFFIHVPLYAQDIFSLEKATVNVASSVGESVVSIRSEVKARIGDRFQFGSPFGDFEDDLFARFFREFFGEIPEREYRRMGLGSGVIIDRDGYILTNEHVISGATEVKVKLADGREFDAEIKGKDERSDLAVIKIEAKELPVARLGDSDGLKIGEWVVAIGNPFGFAIQNPEPTVTVGVISALGRYLPALGRRERSYDDLIQTDAAINPGNSGGPLVNLKGEVIGINTAIITTTGGYQGLGFAIPVNKAKRITDKLLKGEKILYGWLGVNIQDLNEDLRNYFGIREKEGIIVLKVYKNSPAEAAGLKEGDLILAFDNSPVEATRDLVRMVSSTEVGKNVNLKVIRSGKNLTLNVQIGTLPEDLEAIEEARQPKTFSFRGMRVEDITPFYKGKFNLESSEGVVIVDIESDSPADKSGLRIGYVIVKIENHQVRNKAEFIAVSRKIKGNCLLKTNRGYVVVKTD
jgi:serine protease Do